MDSIYYLCVYYLCIYEISRTNGNGDNRGECIIGVILYGDVGYGVKRVYPA